MKQVLFIAYHYPPLGGVGSQRSQKFARYLLDYDWRPIVLTPSRGAYLIDPSLDDGAARGIEIVRTKNVDLSSVLRVAVPGRGQSTNEASRQNGRDSQRSSNGLLGFARKAVHTYAYIPDAQVGWFPYALRAGKRVLERQEVDAIYSTSYPVTAHLVASRVKRTSGKPWVADFRDLFTEFHYREYENTLRRRLDRLIESRLLEHADAIVTVSETLADTLGRLTKGRKRIEIIRNGFDSLDFAGMEYVRPAKWTITYVGLFYGDRQDPSSMLAALKQLIESGRIPREDVLFKIVGEPDEYVRELVARFELTDLVNFTGFVPHREALEHQVSSSLLLLILHGHRANPGVITGKVFEYLGSRRPILGIVPSNFEVADIIKEAGQGVTVDPQDAKGIEQVLLQSYLQFKAGSNPDVRIADLTSFERRQGARQLAALLNDVTATTAGLELAGAV